MVKAKFRVNGIFGGTIDGAESKRIEMSPVFASEVGKEGNACEENAIFGKYTPAGHISITIVNPEAFEQFEVNKEYYVDFFSVEKSQEKEEEVEEQEVEKEEVKTEETGDGDLKGEETQTEGETMSTQGGESLGSTEGQPVGETAGEVTTEPQFGAAQLSQPENTEDQKIAEGEPAGEGTPAQTV